MGFVHDSILSTMGATPTLRLQRVVPEGSGQVFVKLDFLSATASNQERIARARLQRAEREGWLTPGMTVVTATTGNAGIGLALLCAVKGYPLVVCMPESMSLERRALLQGYGARLELTPAQAHVLGAVEKAQGLASQLPSAFYLDFFEALPPADLMEAVGGPEWVQTVQADGGRMNAFVAGVGSGTTLSGVGQALKAAFPKLEVVAVEPSGSAVLSGKPAGPHRQQGLGVGFVAPSLQRTIIDRVVQVEDAEAQAMKERLGREEGLLVGLSTGSNVVAALRLAQERGPSSRVYTIAWDTGERYFSLASPP